MKAASHPAHSFFRSVDALLAIELPELMVFVALMIPDEDGCPTETIMASFMR